MPHNDALDLVLFLICLQLLLCLFLIHLLLVCLCLPLVCLSIQHRRPLLSFASAFSCHPHHVSTLMALLSFSQSFSARCPLPLAVLLMPPSCSCCYLLLLAILPPANLLATSCYPHAALLFVPLPFLPSSSCRHILPIALLLAILLMLPSSSPLLHDILLTPSPSSSYCPSRRPPAATLLMPMPFSPIHHPALLLILLSFPLPSSPSSTVSPVVSEATPTPRATPLHPETKVPASTNASAASGSGSSNADSSQESGGGRDDHFNASAELISSALVTARGGRGGGAMMIESNEA